MIKVLGKLKETGSNEGDNRLRSCFFLIAVVEEIVGGLLQVMWENEQKKKRKKDRRI